MHEKLKVLSIMLLAISALIYSLAFAYDVYKKHQLSPKEQLKLELEERLFGQ